MPSALTVLRLISTGISEGLAPRRILSTKWAAARGHQAPRLVCGAGFRGRWISGAKGRKDRPALDELLKSVARREVDMAAACLSIISAAR
jgi:hypothetical protein